MENQSNWLTEEQSCLNPYYNGRYSWSVEQHGSATPLESLNPYYNGRYSWRVIHRKTWINGDFVLILIIMEDTHGVTMFVEQHGSARS